MAEKYIVNMPLKTTPDDTDLMIIEDAQDTKRMTWANVVKPIKDMIGNLASLNTTHKATVVGAINEQNDLIGTMIDGGSNTNGTYIRFSDGTQICYINIDHVALVGGNSTQTWVFPAQFINVRYHVDMKIWPGNEGEAAKLNYIAPSRWPDETTESQAQVFINMTSAHSYSVRLSWFAVGRWK